MAPELAAARRAGPGERGEEEEEEEFIRMREREREGRSS